MSPSADDEAVQTTALAAAAAQLVETRWLGEISFVVLIGYSAIRVAYQYMIFIGSIFKFMA